MTRQPSLARRAITALAATTALAALSAHGASLIDQWKNGLAGAKLTAYEGSMISSNSTLSVVDFCANGRYRYYKEGSWSVPGQAGGASNSTTTGRWDIVQRGVQTLLSYHTDRGEQGTFPIYLQNNGRVNIGGTAFAVERGAASC